MKKVVKAGATPQEWDADALYAKALRYFERMQREESDEWEHALWASFVLEALARAALSNVSPALLAETGEKNWQHLFHSLGFTPTEQKFSPHSIGTNEVLKRLKDILSDFENELETFCSAHTGRRNAELHSGATPFDGVGSSQWHAKFYRACIVLLGSMGIKLEDFVGKDEAVLANKLIAAAKDETAKSIKGDVRLSKRPCAENDHFFLVAGAATASLPGSPLSPLSPFSPCGPGSPFGPSKHPASVSAKTNEPIKARNRILFLFVVWNLD